MLKWMLCLMRVVVVELFGVVNVVISEIGKVSRLVWV